MKNKPAKKVLLDSSVWISNALIEIHTKKAEAIFNLIKKEKAKIIVPIIVYDEVINTINKFGDYSKTEAIKKIFAGENIKIKFGNKKLWKDKLEKYSRHIKLKTMDLIILTFGLEYKVDKFYSFDKKLAKAYKLAISKKIYEKVNCKNTA